MLEEKPWDILFCDYSLPYLDPYEALEIIWEFDIDIPLIVISGTIGEEKAVELMRSGFHYCVMKNNMGKLSEVVSREIREVKIRRENRILQKRIQKYQLLAEEISDAIFFIDVEGNILEANNAAIKNYGYSREEFLTKSIFELCGSNKEKIIFKEMEKGNREGIIFETIHFRKDGSAMKVKINSHGSLLEGKQILLSIVRDITVRKFAENALIKSENDYRTLVDNAPDIIARLDRSYRFVYFHNRSQIDLNVPTQLAGYNILKSVDFTDPIAEIVYQHHERMDGSGYPQKLKSGEILMEARIISVADVVEAMMSHRPYRPAKTFDEALAEIEHGAGTIYDRDCVQVCSNLFRSKSYQL